MQIHEIKIQKNKKVTLKFSALTRHEQDKEFYIRGTIVSDEPAHQDLHNCLSHLRKYVVDLLELDKKEVDRITVKGAKFTETGKDGIFGAEIFAQRKLSHSDTTQEVVTPHKTEVPYGDSEQETIENEILDTDCVELLLQLQQETEKYLQQFRDQLNIFDSEEE